MSNIITIRGLESAVVLSNTAAEKVRDEAIDAARLIDTVTNEVQLGMCVSALRALKTIEKETEVARKQIKEPVLDLGKQIDTVARNHVAPMLPEIDRLSRLHSVFQAEQQRIAREAEEKRQAELRKIEDERLAAERKRLAEERAAREKAEAEARFATNERDRLAAVQRAEEAKAKAEADAKAADEAAKLRAAAVITAPVVAPIKEAGTTVRTVWKFEVTDVYQLANARVDLVRVEANASAINEAIRKGLRECAGLRIWSETQAGVRV